MKYQPALRIIVPLIGLLALFAASMGLFYETSGQPFPYTNHRGEAVIIHGHGLYFYDTVSTAAQMQGNDLIALVVGLPLLVISTGLAFRARPRSVWQMRGQLLLTGTLGFFLYTYMSMSMLTAYNPLFLVYVVLFGLSLYAFILSMMSFDLSNLEQHFSHHLPRGWIAGVLFVIGGFLSLAWIGRVVPELFLNQVAAIENTTTRVIQAMDLVLIVPMAVIAGILLLRRSAWGYLLASVFIMKAITMGLGVSAMGINQTLAGAPESIAIVVPFLVITLVNLILAVLLLKNVKEPERLLNTVRR